jgi:hypothetical protein
MVAVVEVSADGVPQRAVDLDVVVGGEYVGGTVELLARRSAVHAGRVELQLA